MATEKLWERRIHKLSSLAQCRESDEIRGKNVNRTSPNSKIANRIFFNLGIREPFYYTAI